MRITSQEIVGGKMATLTPIADVGFDLKSIEGLLNYYFGRDEWKSGDTIYLTMSKHKSKEGLLKRWFRRRMKYLIQ